MFVEGCVGDGEGFADLAGEASVVGQAGWCFGVVVELLVEVGEQCFDLGLEVGEPTAGGVSGQGDGHAGGPCRRRGVVSAGGEAEAFEVGDDVGRVEGEGFLLALPRLVAVVVLVLVVVFVGVGV